MFSFVLLWEPLIYSHSHSGPPRIPMLTSGYHGLFLYTEYKYKYNKQYKYNLRKV